MFFHKIIDGFVKIEFQFPLCDRFGAIFICTNGMNASPLSNETCALCGFCRVCNILPCEYRPNIPLYVDLCFKYIFIDEYENKTVFLIFLSLFWSSSF